MSRARLLVFLTSLVACSKPAPTETASAAPTISAFPAPRRTDQWVVASGKFNDHPLLMRTRTELGAFVGHPSYATKITVAYEYGNGGVDGLPPAAAMPVLEAFEDRLFRAVDKDGVAIAVAVATTGGTREFIFYVVDDAVFSENFHKEFGNDEHRHPVKLSAVKDAGWLEYRGILQNAGVK